MSPEDIIGPKGDDQHQHPQHPEVAENVEATMPASELSKQALVDAVDGQLAQKATREYKYNGEVSKGRDLRDTEGNPLSIFRYYDGKENMVAAVIHTNRTEDGIVSRTRYNISRIPDGLSVEKFNYSQSARSKPGLLKLSRDPAAAIEALDDKIAELNDVIAAEQQERELGLTFASEKDVKDITKLIHGAQPHPDEKVDKKFLRQEQHAKSIEGKTRKDESERETDVAKAEFMAHAMNLDMTGVVEMASSNTNEEMIAKLEAQAERKAIQAKAAYELGARSLAEVFGPSSREGMAEQGWRWLTNITPGTSRSTLDDLDFNPGAYLKDLAQSYGDENLTTKPAYNIYDKPVPNMVGVFVKQDAWESQQKARQY